MAEAKRNTVFIHRDRVVEVQEWTNWGGELWNTMLVARREENSPLPFEVVISDPEHGGAMRRGELAVLLRGLHPRTQGEYHALFDLSPATLEAIAAAGFGAFAVQMIP